MSTDETTAPMTNPALDGTTDPDPGEEHLSTGWEPDVPADDTLLRRYLLHWAAYCEGYALAGGGAALRTDAFAAADLRRPGAAVGRPVGKRRLALKFGQW